MKRLITICTIIFVLAVGSAQADMITNPSFEDIPALTSWSTANVPPGAVSRVDSHTDLMGMGTTNWAPTDGSNFALLKSDGSYNFTQLYQSFTAPAGYNLSFDYFWDSQDLDGIIIMGGIKQDLIVSGNVGNDMGRGKLLSGAGTGGSVETNFFEHTVLEDQENFWGTPWTTVSYTIPSAGTYTLLFEIANDGDDLYDSYLGVDNAHVVPVPAAVLLGILGLGVAGWKLRKFA